MKTEMAAGNANIKIEIMTSGPLMHGARLRDISAQLLKNGILGLGRLRNPKQDIRFHDPGEQHWLALGRKEQERREHIPPIMRDAYSLPCDPADLIYPVRRGRTHWVEQIEMKWLHGEPGNLSARNKERYALRELGLCLAEESGKTDTPTEEQKREKRWKERLKKGKDQSKAT